MWNNRLAIVIIVALLLVWYTHPAFAAGAEPRPPATTKTGKDNSGDDVILPAGSFRTPGGIHDAGARNTAADSTIQYTDIIRDTGAIRNPGAGENTSADTILGIYVFGAERTRKYLILKKFGLQPGIPFSEREVDEGLRRVEELSGVEKTSFRLLRNDEEEGVRIIIVVTEQDTRKLTLLARRTFANKVAFGLGFDETNFLGKDEKLHAAALFRGATILEGSWTKPYILQKPGICVGVKARYRFYPYPFPDFENRFVDDKISQLEAAASLYVHPTEFMTVSLSPGVEWIDVADSMLIGQGAADIPPAPSGVFPTFEAKITIDMLDREFYPRSGFSISAARKDWGLLQADAEMKNFLYQLRGSFFLKLWHALFSLDSHGTFVFGRTPITLIQHLGGERSIRGYDFGVLSGDNSLLGRAEVRLPLNFDDIGDLGNPIILVGFNAFFDTGACWNRGESLDTDSFHSGFGCGLHFIPIEDRLIKIGWAWRLESSGMFYFDVGTTF